MVSKEKFLKTFLLLNLKNLYLKLNKKLYQNSQNKQNLNSGSICLELLNSYKIKKFIKKLIIIF